MLLASLLLQVAGAAPPNVATTPARPTVQQRFDAATLASTDGRCAEAVPAFDALERLPGIQRNEEVRITLGLRRARCLIGTDRNDEAEKALAAALPVLERRGTEFAEEIADARRLLVYAAKQRGDYDGAIRENQVRLSRVTGLDRLGPLLALADLTMFDHDGRALGFANEARTLAQAPGTSKRLQAAVQTAYARVLLNEGRSKEAYDVLKDSLQKQGGLTLKVSGNDVETRSDLALAALVNNDRAKAQEYLAYTGAGRLKTFFPPPAENDLPACGTDGLKADDFAIISLRLEADGRVAAVSPIYVGGNRATALAFARVVRGWSWQPEAAAAVPQIFRELTRVEVRCTNGVGSRLALERMLLDAAPEWAADAQGTGTPWEGVSAAAALPRQRAALAQAGTDRRARLRALLALTDNPVASDGYPAILTEADTLVAELQAPAPVRLYMAIRQDDGTRGYIDTLLANPAFVADPLSAAAVRVYAATPRRDRKLRPDAEVLLNTAAAQPGLPDRHPVKVRALLLLANMLGAKGDNAGAQAALARTSLSAEQCSIAGVVPMMKRANANPSLYPDAAAAMGFEGWVNTEFDVAPDGRTITPRTLIAYPPFVFNDAAVGVVRGTRYASSFQPDTAVACSANTLTVQFRLPH